MSSPGSRMQGSIAISKRSNRTLSVSVDGNVAVTNPTVEGAPVAARDGDGAVI
jgi:hypothetical protein